MEKKPINETSIKILNYILKRFNTDFYFINKFKNCIINIMIKNKRLIKLINNKIDTINNNYMDYYNKKYKELIISNFIHNLNYLSTKSYIINNFINSNNLSINNYEKTYHMLKTISLSNVNSFNIILLFQSIEDYENQYFNENTNIKHQTIQHFVDEYEIMIQEYYNKKEAISILNL